MKQDNGEQRLSKWTQQLHDKLAEHETTAPADLWADIESAIAQKQPRKARFVALRRWAAAAAVAVLLVGGGLIWQWQEASNQASLFEAEDSDPLNSIAQEEEQPTMEPPIPYMANKPYKDHKNHKAYRSQEAQESPIAAPPIDNEQQAMVHDHHQKDSATTSEGKTDPHISHPLPEEPRTVTPPRRTKHQPSLSLYAMNGFSAQDNSNAVMMADALVRNYTNAYANGPAASRQAPIYLTGFEERQHHYQPISFGLSVAWPLTQRLSLTSGVVYTKLKSEFTQTIHTRNICQNQVLHYVGVPISLSYRLWQHGGFRVYAAAGGQADWNVCAQLEAEGVEQEMKHDRLQWSASGRLGLQYYVLPQLAVYAEPGFNYHFDNGSPVQNYFKDKPASLNLQIGVRIDLSSTTIPGRYGRAR